MSTPSPGIVLQITRLIVRRRWWLIAPTLICTAIAAVTALVSPRNWKATQTLLVRDEASRNGQRILGRFESADAMKTALETILEIVRNRGSVTAALKNLGPPAGHSQNEDWPSAKDINAAQNHIEVRAPNGAEFGKTEVILVSADAETKERAVAFATSVCEQLQLRMRELRSKRLQSIVDELENHERLGQVELERTTAELEVFERQFGSDLAELRLLSLSGAGESNLRSQFNALQEDLRIAEATRERYDQQQELLRQGIDDPNRLVATPGSLLDSQPGLRRMREDLATAQRACAELEGILKPDHPRLQTAMLAEQKIRENLQAELQVALRGVESDLKLVSQRYDALCAQLRDINNRVDRIAGARARYTNLANLALTCSQTLENSKKELADARASQAAARTTDFLTSLDPPVPSDYPVGPGRVAMVLGGALGGFSIGCGILFMFTPIGQSSLRKCGDYLPFGRRVSDQGLAGQAPLAVPGGRRESDPPPESRRLAELRPTQALREAPKETPKETSKRTALDRQFTAKVEFATGVRPTALHGGSRSREEQICLVSGSFVPATILPPEMHEASYIGCRPDA